MCKNISYNYAHENVKELWNVSFGSEFVLIGLF